MANRKSKVIMTFIYRWQAIIRNLVKEWNEIRIHHQQYLTNNESIRSRLEIEPFEFWSFLMDWQKVRSNWFEFPSTMKRSLVALASLTFHKVILERTVRTKRVLLSLRRYEKSCQYFQNKTFFSTFIFLLLCL